MRKRKKLNEIVWLGCSQRDGVSVGIILKLGRITVWRNEGDELGELKLRNNGSAIEVTAIHPFFFKFQWWLQNQTEYNYGQSHTLKYRLINWCNLWQYELHGSMQQMTYDTQNVKMFHMAKHDSSIKIYRMPNCVSWLIISQNVPHDVTIGLKISCMTPKCDKLCYVEVYKTNCAIDCIISREIWQIVSYSEASSVKLCGMANDTIYGKLWHLTQNEFDPCHCGSQIDTPSTQSRTCVSQVYKSLTRSQTCVGQVDMTLTRRTLD